VRRICGRVDAIAVIDRAISSGMEGPLFTEVQSVLCDLQDRPLAMNFIAGIGGRDVTEKDVETMVIRTLKCVEKGRVDQRLTWYGLRR